MLLRKSENSESRVKSVSDEEEVLTGVINPHSAKSYHAREADIISHCCSCSLFAGELSVASLLLKLEQQSLLSSQGSEPPCGKPRVETCKK